MTFERFDGNLGPRFKVIFADPLDTESAHAFDYRFVGSKTPSPSADEIAEALAIEDYPGVQYFIREHLDRCYLRIAYAKNALGKQLDRTKLPQEC